MSEDRYVPLFERPASGDTAAYAPPEKGGTAPYTPQFQPAPEREAYEPLFPEDAPAYDIPEPDEPLDGEDSEEALYDEDGYTFTEKELAREAAETDWRDVEDPDEREELLARRDFFRTLAGVSDVVLVFLLTAAVLILIWLIVSLVRFVAADLPERFTVLRHLSALPRGGGFLA